MSTRKIIESLNAKKEWREKMIREHRHEIEVIELTKKAFYRDSGMLPFSLMSDAEQQQILKMELLERPCEYCGATKLRKGNRMIVCVGCGHENGK